MKDPAQFSTLTVITSLRSEDFLEDARLLASGWFRIRSRKVIVMLITVKLAFSNRRVVFCRHEGLSKLIPSLLSEVKYLLFCFCFTKFVTLFFMVWSDLGPAAEPWDGVNILATITSHSC